MNLDKKILKMERGDEWRKNSKLVPFLVFAGYLTFSYILNTNYLRYISPWISSYRTLGFFYLSALTVPFTIIVNVFYIYCYMKKDPRIEKYKISNIPWPWEEDPIAWRKKLPNLLFTYFFNYLVLASSVLTMALLYSQPRYDLDSMPSVFEYLSQIMISTLLEDFFFYWSHRFLHLPILYKHVHKKHHEFYNTISLACIYTHPIEFVCGNILPTISGLLIFKSRMHIVTYATWVNLRMISTHDGHSGYDFSFAMYKGLPGASTSEYHNYHHLKNIGNYGSCLRLWDDLFGTNAAYLEEMKKNGEKLKEKTE